MKKALLIDIPSREANDMIPFGIMAAANVFLKLGYETKLIDMTHENLSVDEMSEVIEEFKPKVIGFGGITSSYKNLKPFSIELKRRFPDLMFIAGGVVSSVADLLLEKAKIDVVFHGECEVSLPEFLSHMENDEDVYQTPGIVYIKDGKIVENPPAPQIKNLDELSMPPYHLVDMKRYMPSLDGWVSTYLTSLKLVKSEKEIEEIRNFSESLFVIQSSRGCTHHCTFCFRHMKGVRQQSVEKVLDHMQYIIDTFGVSVFQFSDELTVVTKKWILKFCNGIKERGMNVKYIIPSSRASSVDDEMLSALSATGCITLNYGYESGSDLILKGMAKGTTRADNLCAGRLNIKYRIMNVPTILIGFPEENDETVNDDISFLKELNTPYFALNFPLPFPKTPLWDYCMKNDLIDDYEEYVQMLSNADNFRVNMTKFPTKTLIAWRNKTFYEVKSHYHFKHGEIVLLIKTFLYYKIYVNLSPTFKTSLKNVLKKIPFLRAHVRQV